MTLVSPSHLCTVSPKWNHLLPRPLKRQRAKGCILPCKQTSKYTSGLVICCITNHLKLSGLKLPLLYLSRCCGLTGLSQAALLVTPESLVWLPADGSWGCHLISSSPGLDGAGKLVHSMPGPLAGMPGGPGSAEALG